MNRILTRLIAMVAALALASLGSWGPPECGPEAVSELRRWLGYALELALLAAGAWRERRDGLRLRRSTESVTPALPASLPGCGRECTCECHRRAGA